MSAQLQDAFETGIRSRVPWDEYITLEGLSISRLKELGRSPQHYLYRIDNPKESTALQLGTAAHTAVLEPERFERQYAIWDRRSDKTGNLCPRNGQYWEAFLGANPGKDVITEDELVVVRAIQSAVRAHPAAAPYLANGDPEVTMQWTTYGRPSKGRVDWLTWLDDGKPVLVGLKTARDCRHFIFGSQAARLGYHLQWAYYFDGYKAIKQVEPKVVEIVVESEPPHAVAVYSIPPDIIAQGRDDYERLLDQLATCESTGVFPGPSEIEEPLSLPSWVYEQNDDLSDIGLE